MLYRSALLLVVIAFVFLISAIIWIMDGETMLLYAIAFNNRIENGYECPAS